jgi:hypothetical protein
MIQATLPRRSASPIDLGNVDLNRLAQQAMQPWATAFDSWRSGLDSWNSQVTDMLRPMANAKSHCGCPVCAPDPCTCRCCISDADLVIEARVGERRIVPVIIENQWRRERDIEVELSSWTKVSEGVHVDGEIFGPNALKLAPCGRSQVVLVLTVGGDTVITPGKTIPSDKTPQKPAQAPAQSVRERQLPDVDRCLVSYADLRIKGCDLRSIRVAVAVLPRDCEAFTVGCGCSCCC